MAGTLSGGEQQMVALARGLMARPKLLMLDEPSLGLAPLVVEKIFEAVETIHREGVTVLLVEQNVHEALTLADRAYVLENGKIALEGPGKDLLDNEHVRGAYLGIYRARPAPGATAVVLKEHSASPLLPRRMGSCLWRIVRKGLRKQA